MDRIVLAPMPFRYISAFRSIAKRSSDPGALDLRTADRSGFHAHLEFRRVGMIEIMTNIMPAIDCIRTPSLLRDGDDTLMVMLLLSGKAYQTQLGEGCELNAGDTVICNSACAGEYNLVADSKVLGVKIPRMRLSVLLPHMSNSRARNSTRIRSRSGCCPAISPERSTSISTAASGRPDCIRIISSISWRWRSEWRASHARSPNRAVRGRRDEPRSFGRSKPRWPIRRSMPPMWLRGLASRSAMSTIYWSPRGEPSPNICSISGWRKPSRC